MNFKNNSGLVQQVLTFAGLGVENPCDTDQVSEQMREKMDDFREETKETINSLSAKSFGTFLVTIGFLMAQFAAGAGLAVLDALVVGGIFTNILGTVSMLVAMALASLTGAAMMLRYLAMKRLHEALLERIRLGKAIYSEISQLVAYFRALARIIEDTKQGNVEDIVRALKYVKLASVKVGSEAGKISSGKRAVDSYRIDSAQKDIDNAINELTFGTFGATSKEIEKLQSSYNIKADAGVFDAEVPNPVAVVNYFRDISRAINKQYFSEDLSPKERERNMEKAKNFMLELVSELPRSVQQIAFIKIFEQRAQKLFDLIPVHARAFEDATNFINDTITIPDSVLRFFNASVPEPEDTEDFDRTYSDLSLEIKLAEAAVLGLPDYVEKIKFEAGVFKNLLLPASRKLSKIKREMTQYVNKDIESIEATIDISKKKMDWSLELSESKGLLRAAIGPAISFNGVKTYPAEDTRILNEANQIYEQVQDFIRAKEDKSGQVYSLAQQYLSVLALGSVSLFVPGVASNLLSGLQGIRFAVREQIQIDEEEVSQVQTFLHKLQQSVFFNQVIVPSWEQFMSSLQSSTAGMAVVGKLAKGDLSDIVNAIEGVQKASIVNSALECLSAKDPSDQAKSEYDKFADQIGSKFENEGKLDFKEWYENFKRESQQSIRTLKDKQAQLEFIINQNNA